MKKTNCECWGNYQYDDYYGYYTCQIDLDEDEMARFVAGTFHQCPYYQSDDEYAIVRKQN